MLAIDIIRTPKEKDITKYVIYSDSLSALEALKSYTHRNYLVQQIKLQLNRLQKIGKSIEICWIPAHVGILGNEKADAAAKSAIGCSIYDIHLPYKDYVTALKQQIKTKWQSQWSEVPDNNKLRQIKPSVELWQSSIQNDRQTEVLLTRLRLGHTRLTHGFLMSSPHEEIPRCQSCDSVLTIKHILCECMNFNRERDLYLGCRSLSEILGESKSFSVSRILKFLRFTGLLNKI